MGIIIDFDNDVLMMKLSRVSSPKSSSIKPVESRPGAGSDPHSSHRPMALHGQCQAGASPGLSLVSSGPSRASDWTQPDPA